MEQVPIRSRFPKMDADHVDTDSPQVPAKKEEGLRPRLHKLGQFLEDLLPREDHAETGLKPASIAPSPAGTPISPSADGSPASQKGQHSQSSGGDWPRFTHPVNSQLSFEESGDTSGHPAGRLKQIEPVPGFRTDIGGEFRWQGKIENNSRLSGQDNSYNLYRTRLHANARFEEFRVFVEGIDALSTNEDLPPLVIDENRTDLLNFFGEIRIWGDEHRELLFRAGREELLFGGERLVSPLDWANTRRTFDEVAHLLYRGSNWNIDAFWSRPVIPDVHHFDHGQQDQQFTGIYATYRGHQEHTLDVYFLSLLESSSGSSGRAGVPGNSETHTLGSRWRGNWGEWLGEVEGAYQFGRSADLERSAGMMTVGVGRRFSEWWLQPELWLYFDWASGDRDPTDGRLNTFNQLFPLGHKYFGFLDLVGRQNIMDPNLLIMLQPHERVKLLAWYHYFSLDSTRDGLYNAAGAQTRSRLDGTAGSDVGSEIDLLLDLKLHTHMGWQFGYSHLMPGGFIQSTGVGGDADLFYTQIVLRF
jgi:hypothetical protein